MVNVTSAPSTSGASVTPSVSTLPDTLVGFQSDTTQYTYASPAGTTNDVTPGCPKFVGHVRLAVTLAGGDAIWTGLAAGADNQHLVLWNTDATATLSLAINDSGSLAPNRFQGSGTGYDVSPGNAYLLVYYTGNVNAWVIIP